MKPETMRVRFCGGSMHNKNVIVPNVGSLMRCRLFNRDSETYELRKLWRHRGGTRTVFYEYHIEGSGVEFLHSGDEFNSLFDVTGDANQPSEKISFKSIKELWAKLK